MFPGQQPNRGFWVSLGNHVLDSMDVASGANRSLAACRHSAEDLSYQLLHSGRWRKSRCNGRSEAARAHATD